MTLGLSVFIYVVFWGYGGDQTLSQSRTDCEAYFDKGLNKIIYREPDVQAEFRGGSSEMYKFIAKGLILTDQEWEDIGKYLTMTFVIDERGKCFLQDISKNARDIGRNKTQGKPMHR
jgi:hypothetical protein